MADIDGDVPLGDRKNMVFSGCFVTYGRARFLVTSTGMHTEMGRIAALLKSTEEKKTPLQVSCCSSSAIFSCRAAVFSGAALFITGFSS